MTDHHDSTVTLGQLVKDPVGRARRSVVHNDQLEMGIVLAQHGQCRSTKSFGPFVRWDHDTQKFGQGSCLSL